MEMEVQDDQDDNVNLLGYFIELNPDIERIWFDRLFRYLNMCLETYKTHLLAQGAFFHEETGMPLPVVAGLLELWIATGNILVFNGEDAIYEGARTYYSETLTIIADKIQQKLGYGS
jgi:hypothetical protein